MKKFLVVLGILITVVSLGYFLTLGHTKFAHHSVIEDIKEYHDQGSNLSNHFDSTTFVKVHSDVNGVRPFFTELRTQDITSFPCRNCHSVPLSQIASSSIDKAHWDIELSHGGTSVMNCSTCHSSNNLNELNSLTGHQVSLNRSFEICAQCHTSQHKDWQGGAHGKGLSGWNGPRVVKTCVSCHNPHQPKLENRWPSRLTLNRISNTAHTK